MKQIVDKLNKIAKSIDENARIPNRKLIIDSLDEITRSLNGRIVNSHLIVDKLDAIALAAKDWGGDSPTGTITIEQNGMYNVAQYEYADVIVDAYPDYIIEPQNITLDGNKEAVIDTAFDLNDLPTYIAVKINGETLIAYHKVANEFNGYVFFDDERHYIVYSDGNWRYVDDRLEQGDTLNISAVVHDTPCFDYRDVYVHINDMITTEQVNPEPFYIYFLVDGAVVPVAERHLVTPPFVTYEWTGEEIINNEYPILRVVNYRDMRPLHDPRFVMLIKRTEMSDWLSVSVIGENCDVNPSIDVDGWQITINENITSDIHVYININNGIA